MGYIRWVCTKCGAVDVTEGRRPSPHGGTHDCIKVSRKQRKNEMFLPNQTHSWVKDGPATREEYEAAAKTKQTRAKSETAVGCVVIVILMFLILMFLIVNFKSL